MTFHVVANFVISSATDLIQLLCGLLIFFPLMSRFYGLSLDIGCFFSLFNLPLDAVLVSSLFVILYCHLTLRMSLRHLFMNVWSFLVVVLVTLHVSGCCLGYCSCFLVVVLVTPCFVVVVLVILHVFWLLSCLLSMFSGCCLG